MPRADQDTPRERIEARGTRPVPRLAPSLAAWALCFGIGLEALAQPATYRVRFSPADPVVSEGAGELVVDVSIVGCTDPADTVVWDVTAEEGPAPSAVAGSDFGEVAPTEITLGQGSPLQTVRLPILRDDEPDPDESLVLTLRTRGDATLTCAEGELAPEDGGISELAVLVEDDEVAPEELPEISVGHAFVVEGDSGETQMELPIRVSPPSRQEVRVRARTVDGSATAEEDYRPYSGLIRFPPGTEERLVRVPVLGDTLEEDNETFTLELSEPENAVLASEIGEGIIEDDDDSDAVVLEIVGSHDRRASPGEVVVLQVRVRTDSGSAASRVDVAWSLSTDTDGTLLDGSTTVTDASGIATQRVNAGDNPGVSSIVVSDVGGTRRVAFTITVGNVPSRF